ncbi:hypothetical protein GCM10009765_21700 [Fodinicola feengrottensis]|uniref:Uncharacterized protein n=1 Tax=Fodinicola feengrottensis TaxID=435914 RepID=A0ABN2GIR6_9ACTN
MTTQLRLVGVALVALGLAHLVLPRLLGWSTDFAAIRPLTRQIMHCHTFFIGVVCVLCGLGPLLLANELLAPGRLPTAVLAAETVFWGLRWLAQFGFFPPRVWRARRLYVAGFVGFSVLWTWVGGVFALALACSLGVWSA